MSMDNIYTVIKDIEETKYLQSTNKHEFYNYILNLLSRINKDLPSVDLTYLNLINSKYYTLHRNMVLEFKKRFNDMGIIYDDNIYNISDLYNQVVMHIFLAMISLELQMIVYPDELYKYLWKDYYVIQCYLGGIYKYNYSTDNNKTVEEFIIKNKSMIIDDFDYSRIAIIVDMLWNKYDSPINDDHVVP